MAGRIKISEIKLNPDNPRVIKDEKFKQLVKSIQDFPQMLELRPIVINDDNMVLGGNMRLKACKEAGMTEVPVVRADSLTEAQQRRFILADNNNFGEWQWDKIIDEWPEAAEWGLDIPEWENSHLVDMVNKGEENSEWVGMPEIEKLNPGIHVSRLYFIFDTASERDEWILKQKIEGDIRKTAQGWIVNYSTQYT